MRIGALACVDIEVLHTWHVMTPQERTGK
jgi:hypothetical protein